MLLCIDTGNTNTVFSIWDGTRFLSHWRIRTDHRRTADEYYVWLSTLIAVQRFELQIDACIISATAPRVPVPRLFHLVVALEVGHGGVSATIGRCPSCARP